ncbi:MAG: hypothetical protein A2Z64_14975 [Betaproteobacteria bacterium RIFCSPLOWO2_02_67_12]|nr:MAG: hypothetical protein A2Z64_14975 [Betaproteobacteria bacterium RIFCSPLOWO2_02_67_12]OGA29904.1 MAG: hypothetical protein A3I65_09050 [Betaproteobacteria bacterium RIFCSPLOWO2_02_FULL_68_150]OGA55326.1 MAG: hypothetical protein A3F77_03170 [Betaproteobacteria bacterium RIFCSPLOWO2_12_FULL_67_28]
MNPRPMHPTVRLALLAAFLAGPAHAQQTVEQTIWSCRDKSGKTLLTSLKEDTLDKECKVVQRQRVTVVPAPGKPAAKASSPSSFPKESVNDRSAAREKQRQTLERELAQEQDLLAAAQRKLAEQEAIRSGDEKNYARVLERLRPYRDAVEVHGKNIEALKRELSNLYR